MRHILALVAVLVLAGICLAAEFKSDEAKKAQADYLAVPEAAKTAYGQGLAKAKATIDAKAAAATDAISKEAIQSESAAITDELVRLRDADAATFEPREWKSEETRKVTVAYAAELKAAQMKYGQDLTKARQAVLARRTAATDSAAKDALQAEIAMIEEELKQLRGETNVAKPEKPKAGWVFTKALWGVPPNQVDVLDLLQKSLVSVTNEEFIVLQADLRIFGDPAFGKTKTLSLEFRHGKTEYKEDMPQPDLGSSAVLVLPPIPQQGMRVPGVSEKFVILKAVWGAGLTWRDITRECAKAVASPTQPFAFKSIKREQGPDPYPGVSKRLVIWFDYRGMRYTRTFNSRSWAPDALTLLP